MTANDNFPAEKVEGLTATIMELAKKDPPVNGDIVVEPLDWKTVARPCYLFEK